MAYRKAPAKRAATKRKSGKGSGGGYSKGAGGSGYRAGGGKSGRTGGKSGSGVHTVRIVIEQPGGSSLARPVEVNAEVKARKSPF